MFSVLSLALVGSTSREAAAEIPIAKANGWELSADGRFNTFISFLTGDHQPPGVPIWSGGVDEKDAGTGTISSLRIRSGFIMNVFGFNLVKHLTPDLKLTGRFATWVGISQDRSKLDDPSFDARELYVKLEGPWGGVLAGRNIGIFERGAILMDYDIVHGNGLGFPCSVQSVHGGACGFAGHGVLYPGFNAGVVYNTPDLAGFQLTAGIFDPVAITERTYTITPLPRVEAELTFNVSGHLKVFGDALWQRLSNENPLKDPTTMMPIVDANGKTTKQTVDATGYAAGIEIMGGPVQVGGAFFKGKGLGLTVPMDNTPLFSDEQGVLREGQGFVGMASLTFGETKLAGGGGVSQMKMTSTESEPFATLDIPKQQLGISVGFYQGFYKTFTWALEYFRGQYQWYDYKPDAMSPVTHPTQNVNIINTGITVIW
jgi:hypothetical protein